jgi:NADH-quinone oxidoreductase subunit L
VLEAAWVIPLITGVSFFVILFFGKRMPLKGGEVGVAALTAAFLLSTAAAISWINVEPSVAVEHHAAAAEAHHAPAVEETPADLKRAPVVTEVNWFEIGNVTVRAGTLIDGFAVAMLFMVSLISLCVHVFSTNYMQGDVRETHYFAGLSLFTTGMLLLVTASNTLQALVGWEIMGLCSFMLIGHWWDRDGNANSNAALKAFFTTRVGDAGLLVGISILFFAAGSTFDIGAINEAATAGDMPRSVLVAAAVGLLLGVIGKSAQFPLHTWLPDAMAGPTPVSALIHAATMVVAGVYLVARMFPVFFEAFSIADGGVNVVALVGGATVLVAAALAFVQSDIKRVLAYSTVSQLGYMIMALGVGAWTAGVFHMFTHAMFKALLFLGSGSVSHAVHSFDMREMGGLKDHMPRTFWTFIIGAVALAGVPPLAGFWSKDEILLGASAGDYQAFLIVGLAGAVMTAAYMTRCVYLTFFGSYRGHGHPHESPLPITGPLILLAFMSVTVGFLNAVLLFGIHAFQDWVEPAYVASLVSHHDPSAGLAALGTLAALAGIGIGYAYYFAGLGPRALTERNALARGGYTLLANRYYLDHLYEGVIVKGIREPLAQGAYWTNQRIIDGVVNAVGIGARGLARFVYDFVDQRFVDGIVNGTGYTAEESGRLLRHIQTGRVQQYAAVLFAAAGVFALALVLAT